MLAGQGTMETDAKLDILSRVARSSARAGQPADPAKPLSILALAAASYGARPDDDATVPTGFDPAAVALFEAIVEGAYLVATADGVFDEEERRTFERLVVTACCGTVAPQQIAALVGDLNDLLEEDGLDRRVAMLAQQVTKKDHAREVLRIAALLAQASSDVGKEERAVLEKLATGLGLEAGAVDSALADVKEALSAGAG
jgi:tellurite resistance protein